MMPPLFARHVMKLCCLERRNMGESLRKAEFGTLGGCGVS